MAINPLQTFAKTATAPEPGSPRRSGTGSSAFDSLLKSLEVSEANPARAAQQAAAELLRIEMMQCSLSLSGDPVDSTASATRAMESLLAALAGNSGTTNVGPASLRAAALRAASNELPAAVQPGVAADADLIGETASDFLGIPYRFGGEGAAGIDCSSFVQQVFREHQVDLPRTAREQINVGSEVAEGDLKKGDLVFFQTYASYPSHVGIYLGDGKMIHASSGKGEVTISDMDSDYYRTRYLGAKRVV